MFRAMASVTGLAFIVVLKRRNKWNWNNVKKKSAGKDQIM